MAGGWITINGTHVQIDGSGKVVSGPARLRGGGGSSGSSKKKSNESNTSGAMTDYVKELKPDVEYDVRVEHWKKQIQEGNHRPILISDKDYSRIIDGNHTLAAYKELGINPPKIYVADRIEFLNGAADMGDDLKWIEQAIASGKAKPLTPEMLKKDEKFKHLFK